MTNVFTRLPDSLRKALTNAGITEPTPIQAQAIPLVSEGKDVLGIAQTGTGKTAAFLLPLLERLNGNTGQGVRSLILCPTRELAAQVAASVDLFAKHTRIRQVTLFGGVGQKPQVDKLMHGVDIIVATPGRLLDLHEQGFVEFDRIDYLVLDEADRMLDMGFIHDIRKIERLLPSKRQTLFFSATMAAEVTRLAGSLLNKPVRVEVTPQSTPIEKIEQRVLFVDRENKIPLLLELLEQEHLEKVLIFTKTKHGADKVCRILKKNGVRAQQIHGNRTQNQRTQALHAFTTGKVRCLVATDVAARGIDIDDISHVINYDLPMESENYVHRIGRTARAGADGTAYSFSTHDDMPLLTAIHKAIKQQLPVMDHSFHSEQAKRSRRTRLPPRKVPARRPPRRAPQGQWRGRRR